MIAAVDFTAFAQAFTGRMLDSIVLGTALALSAAILLRVLGRRDSSTRFAVWFAVLMTTVGLLWVDGFAGSRSAAHPAVAAITVPAAWAVYAFRAWALISAIALLRVGFGLWQLQKLRSGCRPVDLMALDLLLQQTLTSFQKVRKVRLCTSPRVEVPTVLGLMKPAVVLPEWTLAELSSAELQAVVLHELAHLRRWDDWTNLAQKLVRAILFFHPAVWWIESRLTLEREMACDDAVVAETANAHAYAECLVSVAERSLLQRSLALAQAVVGRMRQTSTRVARILNATGPNSPRAWKPAVAVVGALAMACLAWAPRPDSLVGFSTPTAAQPSVVAASKAGRDAGAASSLPTLPARWQVPTSHAAPGHQSVPTVIPAATVLDKKHSRKHVLLGFQAGNEAGTLQPIQTIFLVVEGQQMDPSGLTLWSVQVMQFTVFHSRADLRHQGVPRKI